MNRTCGTRFLLVLFVCLTALLPIGVGEGYEPPSAAFSDQELDSLVARIALYPDPLLAQILPASTYPSELGEAADWLRSGGDAASIDDQGWDESVRAVAHYPDILSMLNEDMEWTADLGYAFVNQPEDVTAAVQRLRWRAREMGNLPDTNRQQVIVEGDSIQIIPAEPEYMYVPQYDPSVVYYSQWSPGMSPFVSFGLGLAIGGWLTMDFDWGHHHVIYHGWNRPGWVNHARPHVRVRNVYVNRSRPFMNQAWRHDSAHGDPGKFLSALVGGRGKGLPGRKTDIRGRSDAGAKALGALLGPRGDTRSFSDRGKESRAAAKLREPVPSSSVGKRVAPADLGTVRRQPTEVKRTVEQPVKPLSGIFGGYRGAKETTTQSQRGMTSLKSAAPSPPADKGKAPAARERSGARKGAR